MTTSRLVAATLVLLALSAASSAQDLVPSKDSTTVQGRAKAILRVRNNRTAKVIITSLTVYDCVELPANARCGIRRPLAIVLSPEETAEVGTVQSDSAREPVFKWSYTYTVVPDKAPPAPPPPAPTPAPRQ